AFSSYSGPIVSRRKGEGMEFADIREYTHGDPFKRIEWKSTARTGELMVRELHAETTLNVMIILDASDTMAYGQAGQTKLDYSARAVASLVNYLSKRGDFFGLTIVQGQRPARVIPLARGQVQITRILNLLGQLQPNPASPQLARQRTTGVGGGKTGGPILRRWTRRPILVPRPACRGAPSLGRLLATSRTLNRLHPQALIYYALSAPVIVTELLLYNTYGSN